MKKYLFFALILSFHMITAQKATDTLMFINHKPVSVGEFENLYTKNLDIVQDPEQKDVDNYKELFIRYKLELEDAYEKGYDKRKNIEKELKQYRYDLAQRYKTDKKIIDKLVQEAYNRMQKDVRVAHILIQLPKNPQPADTLKAYRQIMEVYQKAAKGEDFEQLALKYSQDPSVKKNKGDIGYINVFNTVYPFETAAYNTPVGQISHPFRTRFGYHIVKVLDKRPARGEVEVAHIMTIDRKDEQKENKNDAKTRIFDIYQQLKNGEDSFENLAKKYSDDQKTARRGGLLNRFGIRQMLPEIEEHSFALQKEGDISEPFQSRYGWHIVKLIKKYPVPDFNQAQSEIEKKVLRDSRLQIGRDELLKKIAEKFPVTVTGSVEKIYPFVTKDFFEKKWKIPQDKINDETFLVVNNDQKFTYKDFFRYLSRNQLNQPEAYKNKEKIVKNLLEEYKKEKLFNYYMNHLEEVYPDFAQTMKEYKEGLMLFYIKSDMVWNKASMDSIGQKKYFETHKEQYKQPKRYRILIVQTGSKKAAKKIYKYLKKNHEVDYLKQNFENLIIKEQTYAYNDSFVKKLQLEKNKVVKTKDGNQYVLIKLLEVYPEKSGDFNSVRGKVITGYQNALEDEWVEKLKEKYPVEINQKVWNQVRAKYKN